MVRPPSARPLVKRPAPPGVRRTPPTRAEVPGPVQRCCSDVAPQEGRSLVSGLVQLIRTEPPTRQAEVAHVVIDPFRVKECPRLANISADSTASELGFGSTACAIAKSLPCAVTLAVPRPAAGHAAIRITFFGTVFQSSSHRFCRRPKYGDGGNLTTLSPRAIQLEQRYRARAFPEAAESSHGDVGRHPSDIDMTDFLEEVTACDDDAERERVYGLVAMALGDRPGTGTSAKSAAAAKLLLERRRKAVDHPRAPKLTGSAFSRPDEKFWSFESCRFHSTSAAVHVDSVVTAAPRPGFSGHRYKCALSRCLRLNARYVSQRTVGPIEDLTGDLTCDFQLPLVQILGTPAATEASLAIDVSSATGHPLYRLHTAIR
jgi:hypothetical protein